VVVERASYFGNGGGFTDTPGQTRLAGSWTLADADLRAAGAGGLVTQTMTATVPLTGTPAEFLTVLNPTRFATRVRAVFYDAGGTVAGTARLFLDAGRRGTINVAATVSEPPLWAVVQADRTVAVERTAYTDGAFSAGLDSPGSAPAANWLFAEGNTTRGADLSSLGCALATNLGRSYHERLSLTNPGATAAPVRLAFEDVWGMAVTTTMTVPAQRRLIVDVNQRTPNAYVGTQISSTSGVPIFAEQTVTFVRRDGSRAVLSTPGEVDRRTNAGAAPSS
jgi:hypothetical protein